ncbi:MAG: septum site-determining protein Ssd, partial [Actinomycetes bacterium]
VAADVPAARSAWSAAPLVVLGSDLAARTAEARLARRPGVVLVGLDLDDGGIWGTAVRVGAETVVFLPGAESLLVDRLGATVDGIGDPASTVAVIGGRGGAGASTLATALALTAALDGLRTMLVDGDPLGGGIDLVLGGEDSRGLRWPDLAAAGGRVSGTALRESLPHAPDARHLTVLSCDRGDGAAVPAAAMSSVLSAGQRSSDLVVVDLPRRVDAAAEVALTGSQVVFLVVPAEVRAAAAAARVAAQVGLLAADVRVVVRGPAPSGLTGPLVADALALPLAGWLKAEPDLGAALERGDPPARTGRGPLAELCRALLSDLPAAHRSAA